MFGGKSLPAKLLGWPFFLTRDLVLPYLSRYKRARSGHLLAVEIDSWVGLFAHLEWFLEIALHCERNGLISCFRSTSAQYVDPARGPDWYAYFFTNPQLSEEDAARIAAGEVPICRIDGIRHLGLPEDYDEQLNLEIAPALVRKYIGIQPWVRGKVDRFFADRFRDRRVLGVHYRGTDKRTEAPVLTYAQVREAVEEFLARNPEFDALFVASDEQGFVDFMERELGSALSVVSHEDRERSTSGTAVHRGRGGDPFHKAEEAVLNCLLLSRCAALIKTASILSGWSKLFNPELRVLMLTSPYEGQLWFPERELVREVVPPDGSGRPLSAG